MCFYSFGRPSFLLSPDRNSERIATHGRHFRKPYARYNSFEMSRARVYVYRFVSVIFIYVHTGRERSSRFRP